MTGCGSQNIPDEDVNKVQTESVEKETENKPASDDVQQTSTEEHAKIKVAYHPHITGVGGILNAIDNGYFLKRISRLSWYSLRQGQQNWRLWHRGILI